MNVLLTPVQLVEVLRADRQQRWQRGDRILAEAYLQQHPILQEKPLYAVELIYHEVLLRENLGETFALEEYLGRFPQYAAQLEPLFEVHGAIEGGRLFHTLVQTASQFSTPAQGEGPEDPHWPGVAGYEILEVLGRGGMGIVYRARQVDLGRVVALKMLSAGAQAEERDRTRFRAEAEAQARLQHPNIAQIFDVGEEQGQPYFALEYIEGGSLAQKCHGVPQSPRTAAALVETLARAVHYAHGRGLVHRDLKPPNVLLTADGTPKVTDFGLAKRWQEGPGPTLSGDVVGTPSYMAPEQALGQVSAIGPATDVYALGAILYELLTGRPPFLAETALETVIQVRTLEPVAVRRLQPKVPKDLETVCLKCLCREPGKRYASALALAEDLQRFQADRPVVARPVRPWERVVKWTRRRPAAAGLVGVAVLLLLGGVAGGLWYAERERVRANQESALRREAEEQRERAEAQGREAEEQRKLAEAHEARVRVVMNELAQVRWQAGQLAEALPLFEQMLKGDKAKLGPEHPSTLASMTNLALMYRAMGRYTDSVALLEEALKGQQAILGSHHPDTLTSMNNLALAYLDQGQPAHALPLLEATLTGYKAKLGPGHPRTVQSMGNLAAAYLAMKQPDKAIPLFHNFLAAQRKVLGPNHPQMVSSLDKVGRDLLKYGHFGEAEKVLRDSLIIREAKQPDDWTTFHTKSMLGGSLLGQQKYAEAETLLVVGYEGMKARAKIIPAANIRLSEALERLVQLYEAWGKKDQAEHWRKQRAVEPTRGLP